MATQPVTLTIPDGTFPGMEMSVDWGGVQYSIAVPAASYPGDEITVELPALEEAAAPVEAPATPGMTPVTLTIPDGTFPGMEMSVEWGGVSYSIAVPEGSGPGQEITVELPSLEEGPPAGRPLATNEYEMVGRRAELVGLVAKAVLNGRKGLVTEYHEDRGRLGVRIDGMQPDVAVKMCNLKELGEEDFCPVSEEPPEAPHAYGLYFSGDRVLVERSDGSQSECTIVEYDEVFETFTVNIGGAVCKYGVEESYIKPIDDMSRPAGDFYIGRRVRVPLIGGERNPAVSDEDKDGTVLGYDSRLKQYSLRMDNGQTHSDVRREEIRVSFALVLRH